MVEYNKGITVQFDMTFTIIHANNFQIIEKYVIGAIHR